MGPKPIFIADGHHRYETACNYRDQIYDSGFLSPDHPANYTLMMCVAMDDPGLIVMPTHRLFRGMPALTGDELAARLRPCFTTRSAGEGPGGGRFGVGRHRDRRPSGVDRAVHAEGRPLADRHRDRGRPGPHGRGGQPIIPRPGAAWASACCTG